MSKYLGLLKQIEKGKYSLARIDAYLPKPPKGPSVSFGSTTAEHVEKSTIECVEDCATSFL